MNRWAVFLLLGLFIGGPINASQQMKAFETDSLAQITSQRQGQAFLMVLWSVDCPPCFKELALLQRMGAKLNQTNIVLISADDYQQREAAQDVLRDYQLDHLDQWIFSANLPERLRYQIDPGWYGELPRAYFYAPDHQRRAHSGVLDEKTLEAWLD